MTTTPGDHAVLRLRHLRDSDESAVRRAQEAMLADDFTFALGLNPDLAWTEYLQELAREHAGVASSPDRVPATFLLAEVGGEIVGRVSIRHRLNDWLLAHGGHIGYGVLVEFRRQGFATQILQQSLIIARAFGIDRALLTCDDDNAGSIRVIEGCGGRLDADWPITPGPVPMRRYWID